MKSEGSKIKIQNIKDENLENGRLYSDFCNSNSQKQKI